MKPNSNFKTVSDLDFAISAKMVDESPPEKRLKLEDANNHEQDEIWRLKEALKEQKAVVKELKAVVKEHEKMLASTNKKLFEVEDEKVKVEDEKVKVEDEKVKVEDEKNKFEAKLVECPVCLTLPRKGPVPCCANGHFVCFPCLGKLREENKLEQV